MHPSLQSERDEEGFFRAIRLGHLAIVKEFFKDHPTVTVDVQNLKRDTDLILAAGRGYDKIVKLLTYIWFTIDEKSWDGKAVLMV